MITFNSLLKPHMTEAEVLSMIAQSSEFESMMVREVGAWGVRKRPAQIVRRLGACEALGRLPVGKHVPACKRLASTGSIPRRQRLVELQYALGWDLPRVAAAQQPRSHPATHPPPTLQEEMPEVEKLSREACPFDVSMQWCCCCVTVGERQCWCSCGFLS